MSNLQRLEVVGRGSETQLQVAENLNKSLSRIMVDSHNMLQIAPALLKKMARSVIQLVMLLFTHTMDVSQNVRKPMRI